MWSLLLAIWLAFGVVTWLASIAAFTPKRFFVPARDPDVGWCDVIFVALPMALLLGPLVFLIWLGMWIERKDDDE